MKLYVTNTSPYARLARIVVIEKGLHDRVRILQAETRTRNSPYYEINPSGRVPYLVDEAGIGMEDSQLICAYLDGLDGNQRFHNPRLEADWEYRRFEAMARSMCDGIAVWVREMNRSQNERSPGVLAHELARSHRMADAFESRAAEPPVLGESYMAHLILAVALDLAQWKGLSDLTLGRPKLETFLQRMLTLPSMRATSHG